MGEDKAMRGGPTCWYNGIDVPCFIGSSENSSIMSELLTAMLEQIDNYCNFDRSYNQTPFLLLDGHQPRLKLPFLQYIHDDKHKWTVCLGVPYGTHLWQVADATQCNGLFKIAFYKAKREYLRMKVEKKGEHRFSPTDIVPLVNMSWDKSFARAHYARKAVQDRGWFPLNFKRLDHPDLVQPIFDTSTPSTSTNNDGPLHLENLGVDTNAGNYPQQLIEEQAKCVSRKRKYEELRRKRELNENQGNLLTKITSVRSTQLAVNSCYTLTTREVLSMMQQKAADTKVKKDMLEAKRKEKDNKVNNNFQASYKKFYDKKKLNSTDMKTLLTRIRSKTIRRSVPRSFRIDDVVDIVNNENNDHNVVVAHDDQILVLTPVDTGISELCTEISDDHVAGQI